MKCHDCGKTGIKKIGLGVHRRWAHGRKVMPKAKESAEANGNGHPFKDAHSAEVLRVRNRINDLQNYLDSLTELELE